MLRSSDSRFEGFSTEDIEILRKRMNEVQKHMVNENELDISETESSNSEETESGDSDSKDDFTPEWSIKKCFY